MFYPVWQQQSLLQRIKQRVNKLHDRQAILYFNSKKVMPTQILSMSISGANSGVVEKGKRVFEKQIDETYPFGESEEQYFISNATNNNSVPLEEYYDKVLVRQIIDLERVNHQHRQDLVKITESPFSQSPSSQQNNKSQQNPFFQSFSALIKHSRLAKKTSMPSKFLISIEKILLFEQEQKVHLLYEYVPIKLEKYLKESSKDRRKYNSDENFLTKYQSQLYDLAQYLSENKIITNFELKNMGIDENYRMKYFLGIDFQQKKHVNIYQLKNDYYEQIKLIFRAYLPSGDTNRNKGNAELSIKKHSQNILPSFSPNTNMIDQSVSDADNNLKRRNLVRIENSQRDSQGIKNKPTRHLKNFDVYSNSDMVGNGNANWNEHQNRIRKHESIYYERSKPIEGVYQKERKNSYMSSVSNLRLNNLYKRINNIELQVTNVKNLNHSIGNRSRNPQQMVIKGKRMTSRSSHDQGNQNKKEFSETGLTQSKKLANATAAKGNLPNPKLFPADNEQSTYQTYYSIMHQTMSKSRQNLNHTNNGHKSSNYNHLNSNNHHRRKKYAEQYIVTENESKNLSSSNYHNTVKKERKVSRETYEEIHQIDKNGRKKSYKNSLRGESSLIGMSGAYDDHMEKGAEEKKKITYEESEGYEEYDRKKGLDYGNGSGKTNGNSEIQLTGWSNHGYNLHRHKDSIAAQSVSSQQLTNYKKNSRSNSNSKFRGKEYLSAFRQVLSPSSSKLKLHHPQHESSYNNNSATVFNLVNEEMPTSLLNSSHTNYTTKKFVSSEAQKNESRYDDERTYGMLTNNRLGRNVGVNGQHPTIKVLEKQKRDRSSHKSPLKNKKIEQFKQREYNEIKFTVKGENGGDNPDYMEDFMKVLEGDEQNSIKIEQSEQMVESIRISSKYQVNSINTFTSVQRERAGSKGDMDNFQSQEKHQVVNFKSANIGGNVKLQSRIKGAIENSKKLIEQFKHKSIKSNSKLSLVNFE